ncbi:MAG: DUF2236 domain-containing protein [Myxococcales bacterium]|nr:DUF2236 domain-containing protein [Myxococcales bacterium]
MDPTLPTRLVRLDAARARWGDRVDRLTPAFFRGDPLADEALAAIDALGGAGWRALDRALRQGIDAVDDAPQALRALFEQLDRVPAWVDWERVDRAGRLLFRAGPAGGIVLAARCLIAGYCSPAGNKPLVLTGRVAGPELSHRLAETGRFVSAVCEPGGLRRSGEGFRITVRVRLMHARVRALCAADPRWRERDWGTPLNQRDLLATHLLFSIVFADGLRCFGLDVDRDLCEDWLHLWRLASTLMGVEAELLPATEREATELALLIRATEGPPDDDARRLTEAMLASPNMARWPGGRRVAEGMCRALLGEEASDGLGLRRTPTRHAVRAISWVTGPMDRVATRIPRLEQRLVDRGHRAWRAAIAESAAGLPLRWRPPDALRQQAEPPTFNPATNASTVAPSTASSKLP